MVPRVAVHIAVAFLVLCLGAGCSKKDSSSGANERAAMADPDTTPVRGEEGRMGRPVPKVAADTDAKEEDASGEDGEEGKPKTWKRATTLANTSRLMVGDDESLPLRGMQVRARVDGFRARVLIDFFFVNPDDRQYEGTFDLRLPNGASPWFLAFGQSAWESKAGPTTPRYDDPQAVRGQALEPEAIMQAREASWIEPKEARMVPREKAAFAYGQTVRRQVDPALMEWAGSGVFNARIFPIAPNKLHRVVVGYDMDLTAVGDDLELQLPIPEGLPSSAVDLNIAAPQGVGVAVTPEASGKNEGPRRYLRLTDVSGQTVTVRLSKAKGVALVGRDAAVGPMFAARIEPVLPKAKKATGSRRAVFMVDTSLSSNPDRFNVWLKLLRSLLDENRPSIEQFAVLFFNVEGGWYREEFIDNTPENVSALMAYADMLVLEGATDLGAALREASDPMWLSPSEGKLAPWDVFCLSDGAATWGEADAYALSEQLREGGAATLFAYHMGMAGGDDAMLRHLTREAGGAVFSVVGESEVVAASTAHNARPWTLDEVRLAGATDLLVAGRPRVVFEGQRLLVVGRGTPEAGAAVVLTLSRGGKTFEVRTVLSSVVESDLALRTYGQMAVEQLEDFLGATEAEATAYARHFRVTGKSTSLLMLETEADYQRFGIVPAADAETIVGRPAQALVVGALSQLAERLGDPKAAFEDQLDELTKTPGVMLEPSAPLRAALAELPRTSFEIASEPLQVKQRTRGDIPKTVLDQLAARTPEYDTLTAEAERRYRDLGPADALKALSSLVEAQPGDGVLARDIGFTAMNWGLDTQAYRLFARVAKARPFEPQTYRAMALSLVKAGYYDLALAYFEIGLAGRWDARFGEFREILLQDYLRFLRNKGPQALDPSLARYAERRRDELGQQVQVAEADILVTITWNTDNTDVDLHVVEPSGEECFYSHPNTQSGGRLTRDVTQGYGPEMYVLAKAPPGKYQVRAKYFASDRNRASARTKVYATITRNWGRAGEEVETQVVTLTTGKEMHDLMTVGVH